MKSGETQDRFKRLTEEEMKSGGRFRRVPRLGNVAALVQQWQSATFGPPETRTGCTARLEHIRREVLEAKDAAYLVDRYSEDGVNPRYLDSAREALASELADIDILLQSAYDEAGMDRGVCMYRKLLENRARTWGKPDADGVIEHDRGTGEESGEARGPYNCEPECHKCGYVLPFGEQCPECGL